VCEGSYQHCEQSAIREVLVSGEFDFAGTKAAMSLKFFFSLNCYEMVGKQAVYISQINKAAQNIADKKSKLIL